MRIASFVLLALILSPFPARAASDYGNCTGYITSVPTVISTPGTWCLNQDVSTAITSGDAITVASDNVTIDCNDFRLDGLAAGPASAALGIHALNRSHLTVRHCTVRGFYRGVHAEGTGGRHVIEDNHTDGNLLVGIKVEGGNAMVRHNVVNGTGASTSAATPYSAYGILAFGTTDILDNVVSGLAVRDGSNASVRGIAMQDSPGSTIAGNTVRGLAPNQSGNAKGISMNDVSPGTVLANTVVGDGHVGYGLECVEFNPPFASTRARGNAVSGFTSGGLSGCDDAGDNDVSP